MARLSPQAQLSSTERVPDMALERGGPLLMVPGMGHCGGGAGADQFDPMTKMVNWIEARVEPHDILSRHLDTTGAIAFTRRLCAYPDIARYGGGNANSAASFQCVPGPTGVPGTGANDGLQFP